ncbi:hypothetical protein [Pleionea sediminis]|uniref:hypothetical protein n=1 Tax=Pleionea sediminis TaxID=2569479 RepID=UPI0011864A26|nr:hypothetical protein [Pleionea sediminis]
MFIKRLSLALLTLSASTASFAVDVCDSNWTLVCRSSEGNIFTSTQPGHVIAERTGNFHEYMRCIRNNPDDPGACDHLMPKLEGKSLHWGAHNFWKKDYRGNYITTADGGRAITTWTFDIRRCSGRTHTLWPSNSDPQWQEYTCTVN